MKHALLLASVSIALVVFAGCDSDSLTGPQSDVPGPVAQPASLVPYEYTSDDRPTLRFASEEAFYQSAQEAETAARETGRALQIPVALRGANDLGDAFPLGTQSLLDHEGRVVIGSDLFKVSVADGRAETVVSDARSGAETERFETLAPEPSPLLAARESLEGLTPEDLESGASPQARVITSSGDAYGVGPSFQYPAGNGQTYYLQTIMAHDTYSTAFGHRRAKAETEVLHYDYGTFSWKSTPASLYPTLELRAMTRAPLGIPSGGGSMQCTYLINVNAPGGGGDLYIQTIGDRGTGYGMSFSKHSVSDGALQADFSNIVEHYRLEGQETSCDTGPSIRGVSPDNSPPPDIIIP